MRRSLGMLAWPVAFLVAAILGVAIMLAFFDPRDRVREPAPTPEPVGPVMRA